LSVANSSADSLSRFGSSFSGLSALEIDGEFFGVHGFVIAGSRRGGKIGN